jgi:hypothetical protein
MLLAGVLLLCACEQRRSAPGEQERELLGPVHASFRLETQFSARLGAPAQPRRHAREAPEREALSASRRRALEMTLQLMPPREAVVALLNAAPGEWRELDFHLGEAPQMQAFLRDFDDTLAHLEALSAELEQSTLSLSVVMVGVADRLPVSSRLEKELRMQLRPVFEETFALMGASASDEGYAQLEAAPPNQQLACLRAGVLAHQAHRLLASPISRARTVKDRRNEALLSLSFEVYCEQDRRVGERGAELYLSLRIVPKLGQVEGRSLRIVSKAGKAAEVESAVATRWEEGEVLQQLLSSDGWKLSSANRPDF